MCLKILMIWYAGTRRRETAERNGIVSWGWGQAGAWWRKRERDVREWDAPTGEKWNIVLGTLAVLIVQALAELDRSFARQLGHIGLFSRRSLRVLWASIGLLALLFFVGIGTTSSVQTTRDGHIPPDVPAAICQDRWISYSQHRQGTCSWHHGVAQWIR